MARLVLFSREGCHLCTDMEQALRALSDRLDFTVEIRDVDSNAALEATYGLRVPVLLTEGGTEICHYHLDVEALRRALRSPAEALLQNPPRPPA